MELNLDMVELLTDPEKFREYMRRAKERHEAQKKAKRDYYHRNKEEIAQKRKAKRTEGTTKE